MIEDSVSEPGRRDGGDAGKRLAWLQRQVLPVLEEGKDPIFPDRKSVV